MGLTHLFAGYHSGLLHGRLSDILEFICYIYQMIQHILFDLDCTLYSVSYGLEEKVFARMMQYVARYLDISVEQARAERNKQNNRYGTTLEWLMAEKKFSAIDDYLVSVHPEDEADTLRPDPELRHFLKSLPCPCSILTNSPGFHAVRIVKKLELEGVFYKIFDIEGNRMRGKPHASSFHRALDTLGLKPEEVLFVDDVPRYVEGYLAIGGRGLLLDERNAHADYPHERIKDIQELARFLN